MNIRCFVIEFLVNDMPGLYCYADYNKKHNCFLFCPNIINRSYEEFSEDEFECCRSLAMDMIFSINKDIKKFVLPTSPDEDEVTRAKINGIISEFEPIAWIQATLYAVFDRDFE